ncbi:Filament-like plant protein [Dillenia turbinata]|uniref:Filament-like plant protein n=1 Tax=Dillenia turbinata TaxID=194707 RepID=A0AAN8VAN1_9MAGN
MDRRSWLWRRKSSEKSLADTESSAGSISSHSERFSDDHACPNHTQSPEITSKASPVNEEFNDDVKILKDKLSVALLNISAKEDLVKQHAKVAEEAVSGWEKAESEVLILRQKLEALTQNKSVLEDRVAHLDGALRECMRQLRQAREEQEQKIQENILKKTNEWQSAKSELENQIADLTVQLQIAKGESVSPVTSDLLLKLEVAEEENSALKFRLLAQAEELEIRTLERDLSTRAAESASKQRLKSIKKVVKLEAECRRLKTINRKSSASNDNKSFTASVYAESITDNQSDTGDRLLALEVSSNKMSGLEANGLEACHSELWASALVPEFDQFKNGNKPGRSCIMHSGDINLMDDFLEMERLVALPERENCSIKPGIVLNSVDLRTTELEEKLERMKIENEKLEKALTKCEDQLETSQRHLQEVQVKLVELETQLERTKVENKNLEMALAECQEYLETSQDHLQEGHIKLVELESQLACTKDLYKGAKRELESSNAEKDVAESRIAAVEAELKIILKKVALLEEELEKEQALSGDNLAKCRKLEDELSSMKHQAQCNSAIANAELKIKQEKELAVAATKFAECQKTIASLGRQLKSLATLEDFLNYSEKSSEHPNGLTAHNDTAEP